MNLVINHTELNEFCKRWKEKADKYNNNTLEDYFDRFFTLYVIFNRIYNEVVEILREQGELDILREQKRIFENKHTKRIYEKYESTICVAHILRNELNEIIIENQQQIDDFKIIIEKKMFNIVLNYGKPQRKKDLELKIGLESEDNLVVVENLLIILYNLRCNIFHAEKGFYEFQRLILDPANVCLNNLVERLIEKLRTI